MVFKSAKPKVDAKAEPSAESKPAKFKSELELVQFLKNAVDLKPAEKQKLLDDFREK